MTISELFRLFSSASSLASTDRFLLRTAYGGAVEVPAETVRAYLRKTIASTFDINDEGYVVINGTTTNYQITPQDISDLTTRIESIEQALASGNLNSGSDEVYIGSSSSSASDAELWVDPTDTRSLIISGRVDENNHLILTVPDPEPILKAKVDGQWTNISPGIGSGAVTSLSVTDYIQIGSVTLRYDSTSGSLILTKSDGTTTTL